MGEVFLMCGGSLTNVCVCIYNGPEPTGQFHSGDLHEAQQTLQQNLTAINY